MNQPIAMKPMRTTLTLLAALLLAPLAALTALSLHAEQPCNGLARGLQLPSVLSDATMLHQLGIDHLKLTHRHLGRDFRLTDVYGEVLREILA